MKQIEYHKVVYDWGEIKKLRSFSPEKIEKIENRFCDCLGMKENSKDFFIPRWRGVIIYRNEQLKFYKNLDEYLYKKYLEAIPRKQEFVKVLLIKHSESLWDCGLK